MAKFPFISARFAQLAFWPHLCSVFAAGETTEQHSDIKANYSPGSAPVPGPFQGDAPNSGRLLLKGNYSHLNSKQRLTLKFGTQANAPTKALTISRVQAGDPAYTTTLLFVTPSN